MNQVTAEMESAVQANRNYQSELVKIKGLNEQLVEQVELINRDKRRFQGNEHSLIRERRFKLSFQMNLMSL